MRILSTLVCALLLLPLTACGNGDEEKAKKAISTMMRDEGTAGQKLSKKESDCVGDQLVEGIGVEKLQEYDLLTEDLKAKKDANDDIKMSKKDAGSAASALVDCVDLVKAVTESAGTQFTAEQKQCLEDTITKKLLRDMFTQLFMGEGEAATKAILTPMMECASKGASPSPAPAN
jgi:hypothetical protein